MLPRKIGMDQKSVFSEALERSFAFPDLLLAMRYQE
jgi:hypothetical protein